MNTINIMTMTPNDILKKEPFKRTLPSDQLTQAGVARTTGDSLTQVPEMRDPLRYELFSQADFLREYDMNSHNINSLKYYPNPLMHGRDSEGQPDGHLYHKIKTRVAIAFQERIFTKRLNCLTGNNVNLRIINHSAGKKEQELLAIFREGWETHNMETAIFEAIGADGKTGDCAISFFMRNGKFGWRVFSYEKGDILYPHYDPYTGELAVFGRKYYVLDSEGSKVEMLDVWDDTYYSRYKYVSEGKEKAKWQVDQEATPHQFKSIPIAYDRYGGPFWANSQSLIEEYEFAISQLCENNMAYALRILYAFGAEMDMHSTIDGTPTQINSASTDAKVGFLEPADASNSFTLQLTTIEKNIMKCSFAVDTPEIKSGADMSSLTIKMLYADAYQKAILDSQHFQPFIDKVVNTSKYGFGIEEGKSSDFEKFKVKGELFPYMFMSETEEVANITQLTGIGAMSKRTASEKAYELGYGVVGEWERIQEEENAVLAQEANIQRQSQQNVINLARNRQNGE